MTMKKRKEKTKKRKKLKEELAHVN